MAETQLELSPDFLRQLEFLRVASRRMHTGRHAAMHRSRKLGRGIDFADHRPYTPGDDFKDIDWNLYGRMDRLMVRVAEEETELNLHLLVDCSGSMGLESGEASELTKAEFGRRVATALAYIALARLDRVHVHPFAASLQPPLTPPRNKAQALRIYRYLRQAETQEATDFEGAARAFAAVAPPRGLVVVLSDFLAPGGWQRGLDLLRHARYEVAIIHLEASDEARVEERGELILRDSETGRRMRIRVTERVAAAYRQAVVAHGESLQDYARAHNLACARAVCDEPFEELVLSTLRTQRLLH